MPKLTITNAKAKQIYVAHSKFKRHVHPTVGRTAKIENSELEMKDEDIKHWDQHHGLHGRPCNHDAVRYNIKLRKKMQLQYCNRCDIFKHEKCFSYACNQCRTCVKETRIDGQDVKRLYKALKRDFKDKCTSLIYFDKQLSFKKYLESRLYPDMKQKLAQLVDFMNEAEKRGYYCTIDENHINYDPYFLSHYKRKPDNGWWWNNGLVAHPTKGLLEDWFAFKILMKEAITLSGVRESAKKRS